MSLGAGRSISVLSRVGAAIGKELSCIGVNWHSSPAVHNATLLTEPLDASQNFSDDSQAVSHYAQAFLEGLSTARVTGCPRIDLTASVHEVYHANNGPDLDLEDLLKRDDVLALYHSVGMQGLDSVLLTVAFDQFEDASRAGVSYEKIVKQILRQRFDYQGLVIFDCSQISREKELCVRHAPLRALLSGSDMVLLPPDGNDQLACIQAIHAAAESAASLSTTNPAIVAQITAFKARHFQGWSVLQPTTDYTTLRDQHAPLAQIAYRRATTVLSGGPSPILDLPATYILLLMAPSVPSPLHSSADAPTSDPFECLGRTLAEFHPRTRHVPYTLSAGLTTTHTAFLDRASAVVLVICNPSSAFEESQEEFIRAIQDHIRIRESTPGEPKIAKIVLAAGDPRDLNQPLEGWWEVCCYEYTKGALEAAAEVITGQRTATGRLPIKIPRYLNGEQDM